MKKEDLIKISYNIWEIPKNFREDMIVPARVFVSEEMLDELFKDKSLWQLVNLTTLPGIYKYALAMPDIHEGYGSPVGGVAAFDIDEGIISPGICGYDINCGVRLLVSNFYYNEIKDRVLKLTEEIFKQVPSGVGRGGKWRLNKDEMRKVLEEGAKYIVNLGWGDKEDLEATESFGCLEEADHNSVSETAKKRGEDQLGTIGAGNHFVEIQRVTEIFDKDLSEKLGLEKDKITVLIHCGSRGLGHQVASDYIRKALNYINRKNIKLPDRELAYFYINDEEGKAYFSAMKCSANFAWANRQLIAYYIRKAFNNIMGAGVKLTQIYDVAHNIVKIEEHENKKLIVHRKGATRAFYKGHPDLPKKFQDIGQPVLIPGSMGTASYVLIGEKLGEELSFASAPHGAGRVMSRAEAKRKIIGSEIKKELENKGIKVASGSLSGLAEEAPDAYKDVAQVVEVVHNIGLAKKIVKLSPLGVIKG